jgi:hypothetical protein
MKENSAMLKGDFAGYKNCTIGIATLEQKDLVRKVVVFFPERHTWASLSQDYFSLKEMLTEKYGEPSEIIEKFDTYSEPRSDAAKMYEVRMFRCRFFTTYETEKGTIDLSIGGRTNGGCIVLSYWDKINDNIKVNAKDDL